ncbi:MAG: Ubiquinone/menaquinone biosynthesis C-methyltransferase UbiE [Chlamydiae bacterium]|nr:Ubiquinone/menaquinone biosynthesis C-methyltransferase UbiE [Chlamydiota bacterium]
MFKVILSLMGFVNLVGSNFHTQYGTEYGQKAAEAYAESNHGPDGALFLDPYFKPMLENLHHSKVLDAGCGAAPWSIYAAKNGGRVYAIDVQDSMVQAAKKAISAAKMVHKIALKKGDVGNLPYKSKFFDREISICVACNLPIESFYKHFFEFKRTLKDDGIAVVAAPSSLDIAFSDGSKTTDEISSHIDSVLRQLPNNPDPNLISERLLKLTEVLSATFYIKNGRLVLLKNENEISNGQEIWRKLPKLAVPNRYYSQDYYLKCFKNLDFKVLNVDMPHFNTEEERLEYNRTLSESKLGPEYLAHAPFSIYRIQKNKESVGDEKNQSIFAYLFSKNFREKFGFIVSRQNN